MILKSAIKITKGFVIWAKMVKSLDQKLSKMTINFLLTGTENDNSNQLHAITIFPDMKVLQVFGSNYELSGVGKQRGTVIERGVMTPISENYFINYPDAIIQHDNA